MQAAEAKLQRILEGDRQFLVPHFQRPYSWREKHWETLWRDLLELVTDPESKPHFLGSIVSSPARSVPEGVEKRLLIDGQQRLTTILLVLALIRDRAATAGSEKLAERIGDLITNRHEAGNDRFKLLPTQGDSAEESDRDAFMSLVDRRTTDSKSGVADARAYFANKLQRSDAPNLEDLFRAITSKLTLVSIILDERDNPHRIFESLNGKGRPLSQTDLIRNYFFMRLPESEHEPIYRNVWRPMQSRLGEEALTEFVRHYLMHFGSIVNESDIYSTLKDRIDAQSRPVADHLNELAEYAKYYEILIRPEKAPTAPLRERLHRLRRLEVTVAYPFILPMYADFARGTLSEAQLCDVLDVVETYVIRRFVCGVPTHGLNKIFTPLYQQARKHTDVVANVRGLLADRACPRDEQFREHLDSARLYGGGERRERTKLLLERLNAALGHKEKVDPANLTIEHVMPQTLTPWWKQHLGEDWEDDHETLLHTLGNLTLTAYNSELSNLSYDEKKTELSKSHFELNRYFVDVDRWDAAEIERRADALVDLALTVWPYFGPPGPKDTVVSTSDVTSTLPRSVSFRGREHPVRSWVDVMIVTLEQIIADGPDDFVLVETELSRVVNRDPTMFRRTRRLRRLSNGAYVEANWSASAIHRICLQAVQAVGLGVDEWSVEYVSLAGHDDDGPEDAPSEVKQLQLEFWTQARAALASTGKITSLRTPRPRYWFDIAVGRSGFRLSLTANVSDGELSVKLVLNDVAEALTALATSRLEIEKQIGQPLEWDPHPEKKFRTIRLVRRAQIQDRTIWPEAIDWLTKTTIAFRDAFGPRIAELDLP